MPPAIMVSTTARSGVATIQNRLGEGRFSSRIMRANLVRKTRLFEDFCKFLR
jgi:hypothetical protein